MAPSKCNCVVFSRNRREDESDILELNLFGEKISNCKSTTFLGIRFDNRLSFSDQVSYIENTCLKRLNILKILSNRRWKVRKEILVKIFVLLIRSIIDYSSLILSSLCKTRLLKLQRIQNSAIRTIFHLSRRTSVNELHRVARLETIEARLKRLNRTYVVRGLAFKNPIVIDLVKEFLNFSAARDIAVATPLCSFEKEELRLLLNSLIPP